METTPIHELVLLDFEIKSPPFSTKARTEAGYLLWQLQQGQMLSMPQSRPMPSIGSNCHELRIRDAQLNWRIIYHLDASAATVVILNIFGKKTEKTPDNEITRSQASLANYLGKKKG